MYDFYDTFFPTYRVHYDFMTKYVTHLRSVSDLIKYIHLDRESLLKYLFNLWHPLDYF